MPVAFEQRLCQIGCFALNALIANQWFAVGQASISSVFIGLIRALVHGGDLYLVVAHGYFEGG